MPEVPLSTNEYVAAGIVPTLLETVIDYQQNTVTVNRAMSHFEAERPAGSGRSTSSMLASRGSPTTGTATSRSP